MINPLEVEEFEVAPRCPGGQGTLGLGHLALGSGCPPIPRGDPGTLLPHTRTPPTTTPSSFWGDLLALLGTSGRNPNKPTTEFKCKSFILFNKHYNLNFEECVLRERKIIFFLFFLFSLQKKEKNRI